MAGKVQTLKIGDKEYKLKFTLGSFVKFQEETGKNPFKESLMEGFDPIQLKTLLYCFIAEDIDKNTLDDLEIPEMMGLVEKFEALIPDDISKKK